jgi:hypothetical protein
MNEEHFESIYEEIAKEPQKAILVFDGLDEYHGNPINCLDQSRIISNDPNTGTSAMNLFIKLVLGDLLKGATVVVTRDGLQMIFTRDLILIEMWRLLVSLPIKLKNMRP